MLLVRASAQQPAYFTLGEKELKGVEIYDVIQDRDWDYWFATNEGIYHFNYYSYEKVECDEAQGSSFFSFVMDDAGTIYCHNLNSQVFRITDNECSLFYQLQTGEESIDMSLAIGDDGNLIIGAKKLIVLDPQGSVVYRYSPAGCSLGPSFVSDDQKVQFHLRGGGGDSVLNYANGVLSVHPLQFPAGTLSSKSTLKFFLAGDRYYGLDLRSKALYTYDLQTYTLSPLTGHSIFGKSESARIYETGDEIWVADALPGVRITDLETKAQDTSVLYGDHFISNVYKDQEGNFLLCTFNNGVLVIPDLKISGAVYAFRDDPVHALYADPAGLLLGSSKGKLMRYDEEKLEIINNGGARSIEVIYGHPAGDCILFNNIDIRAYSKSSGKIMDVLEASLKDAAAVSENVFYLGTNTGIVKAIWNGRDGFTTETVKGMPYRIYAVAYHPGKDYLYASTAKGLFEISSSGLPKEILYQNASAFPNDLTYAEGKIYASTEKNGILIIENGLVTAAVQPAIGGKPEALKKILVHQNTLIGSSSNGLFRFSMKGELLQSVHSVFGFNSTKIFDFTFYKNSLWVSHAGGIQEVDLHYIQPGASLPQVRFAQVFMNGKETDPLQTGYFRSNQKKIEFVLSCPTLRNHETIHYYYRLAGYDTTWNVQPYGSNRILYNALAPGSYVLEVKVENQGAFGEVISYSFRIVPPFYARWWFIGLGVILFLGIVFIIYKWRLNIYRRKSRQQNELNASKLTAIQSQMNPHFIFNSLNSIQDLILKGDVEHSYSYITTFSNLVRRTLNYSEKEFIDFEQEIKLLELYLSLEKLRFKKNLDYEINIHDVENIMIPPLLIQPFIENALVHGLLHKEGKKELKISFELREELICTIEDNGIGREKSNAIQQRQRAGHESFSGKAIRTRFEILSSVLEGKFGYTYEDLYKNNEPAGTKVILTIPVKRKF